MRQIALFKKKRGGLGVYNQTMQMTLPMIIFFQVNDVHTDSKGLNKNPHNFVRLSRLQMYNRDFDVFSQCRAKGTLRRWSC